MRAAALALVIVAMPSAAAEFDLDPAHSVLRFTLPATLHTVRGEFRFLHGTLAIDASGGTNGLFVVDATSANTGNSWRDQTLHEEVLESDRFAEIEFRVRSVEFAPGRRRGKIGGEITLRGAHHPLELDFELEVPTGDRLRAEGSFSVSYVAWGLPDVSTAILRVAPVVSLEFRVEGRVDDWAPR